MPCHDGREAPIDTDAQTRFCCETLKGYDERGEPVPDYIALWWKEHKMWDAWRAGGFNGPYPGFTLRRW